VMYELALSLNPQQVEAIAAGLYMEMLEAGFTRVGEFHYLHHDIDGHPYTNRAEMAQSIVNAAQDIGIALTLLPIFYAHADFGGMAPDNAQRRFINSIDSFTALWQDCIKLMETVPEGKVGLAAHSLRAVTPEELTHILPLARNMPIHIHIAEQMREVEACLAWSGSRPVAWLMEHAPVDENWTLIHATHIDRYETTDLAQAQSIVGLCPITEANLGDGIFPASLFLHQGEEIAIGSDSNIFISAAQELRQLEYSQRLDQRMRNVIAHPDQSTGLRLFDEALRGGARSIRGNGYLAVGKRADFVTLAREEWVDCVPDGMLDQWLFGMGVHVDCVFVGGRKRVEGGQHLDRERIVSHFAATVRHLWR